MMMKKTLLIVGLTLAMLLSACSLAPQPVSQPSSQGQVASIANSQPPVNAAQPQQGGASQVNNVPPARAITVNGQGQVILPPELAYVYIGVHSQAEDVAQALADNNDKTQAVAQALKDLGIEEKDIQTSSFNIYPQQQYTGQPGETAPITYYSVDNTVYVTVRNLQNLGQLLDTAVRSGANSINGINFDVNPESKAKAVEDARKVAVDSARAQAQSLADAAGVQIDQLVTLTAYTSGPAIPLMDAKGGSYAAGASQVPISAGQIVISVDVSASYSIK